MSRLDKPHLADACDTDEVYDLAYRLAGWGLRNGECDEHTALDWVLSHPHEGKLPRGSHGLNPTLHHIRNGVNNAVKEFIPGLRGKGDYVPGALHELAARISGSGVTHERYLLGAIALCFENETTTPVITGPTLARVTEVSEPVAGRVLRQWQDTLAYGFFTDVSYDGIARHGRVWTVDPGWVPRSRPKHQPGCNRSKSRCRCPGVSQKGLSIFHSCEDRSPKVRQSPRRDTAAEFSDWLKTLDARTSLDVTAVARHLGVTRHAASRLLRDQQGKLLDDGTYEGGWRWKRDANGNRVRVRQGETWFVL